jgi:hypothetical protein
MDGVLRRERELQSRHSPLAKALGLNQYSKETLLLLFYHKIFSSFMKRDKIPLSLHEYTYEY